MGLGGFKEKLKNLGKSHGDKVEQGIDKASQTAKNKFGYGEKIDRAAEKGKEFFRDDEGQNPQQGQQGENPQQGQQGENPQSQQGQQGQQGENPQQGQQSQNRQQGQQGQQ